MANIPTINEKFLDDNGNISPTWYTFLRSGSGSTVGDVVPNFFILPGAYIQESNYWLNLSIDNGWLSGLTYQGAYEDLLNLSNATSVYIRFITSDERDTEISTYGESGAFVLDKNNKRFKIPMITKSIGNLSTLSEIGTAVGNSAATGTATYAYVKFPYFMKVGNKAIQASAVDLKKEAADQKAAIFALGQAQLEAITTAGETIVSNIENAGDNQLTAINSAGTIQVDGINLVGTTQKNEINALGASWETILSGYVDDAELAATNAATSATNALTSETNAATSATNALTSETNAATSATNALTSETNAATSAANALISENNASDSADEAAGYAAQAGTSALPLFTPLFLDYDPNNSGYVLADGSSWVSGTVYADAYAHLLADYNASSDTSETVGGVNVTYRRASDGHKIISSTNLTHYTGVLSATGTAWYYVLDTTNTRFMLPFTNWFIQSGATTGGSLAAYQAAGLPNITGTTSGSEHSEATTNTGAFYPFKTSGSSPASGTGSNYGHAFDASLSNAIYGNSTTVQPQSNKLALYFVCGNTVVNEYLIDAAGLADKDLSNLSNAGKSVIGSYLGTCSTASATAAKEVAASGFVLSTGARIKVKFDNANTVAGTLTLNVNSTGAIAIYNEAGIAVSATSPAYFPAGADIEFWYDGTYWRYVNRVVDDYVNGTDNYEVYSNGKIRQWGIRTLTGSGWETITLLKTMKNTDYSILTTHRSSYDSASSSSHKYVSEKGGVVNYATESTTSFQVWGQTAGFKTNWQVEGY